MKVNITASEKQKLANLIKNDPIWKGLMTADYAQIDNWIDNNVNNIDDIRKVMKRMAKILVYLSRHLKK